MTWLRAHSMAQRIPIKTSCKIQQRQEFSTWVLQMALPDKKYNNWSLIWMLAPHKPLSTKIQITSRCKSSKKSTAAAVRVSLTMVLPCNPWVSRLSQAWAPSLTRFKPRLTMGRLRRASLPEQITINKSNWPQLKFESRLNWITRSRCSRSSSRKSNQNWTKSDEKSRLAASKLVRRTRRRLCRWSLDTLHSHDLTKLPVWWWSNLLWSK